jgi:hypothetical protein
MLDKIKEYFDREKLKYVPLTREEEGIFFLGINGQFSRFHCIADLKEDMKVFLFYAICSINISQDKIDLISKFLTKINYGRMIGNFELDMNDGEIRYKVSLNYEDIELTNTIIHNIVSTCIPSMDIVTPIIGGLVYGNLTLEEAFIKATAE